jgi:hypothetical protein
MTLSSEAASMVRMVCRNCNYSREMSEFEAEVGMLCPRCHCQNLRPPIKTRPGESQTLRTSTVQALVGSIGTLVLGPVLIVLGYRGAADPDWPVERFVLFGVAFLIFGLCGFGYALYSVYRDLTPD